MTTGVNTLQQVNARELREQVQRDVQQALREAQEAVAAQRAAAQAGGAAGGVIVQPEAPPPPPEPGRPFRVEAGGRVIDIDEGGVTVARVQEPSVFTGPQIPPEAVVIALAFFAMVAFILVGWPIARAIARRMDRAPAGGAQLQTENAEQLRRIEQAVEAVSIEVERISEGQRFVTRLLAERQPEVAEHVLPHAEPVPVRRDAR